MSNNHENRKNGKFQRYIYMDFDEKESIFQQNSQKRECRKSESFKGKIENAVKKKRKISRGK